MHQHGYAAASTTAIADAAGVSPATLFNYFPTKSSIVFADNDLWVPRPGAVTAQSTPQDTLRRIVLDLLDKPGWTRPADDPLTHMRFELVRGEPALAAQQTAHAFSQVPALAAILSSAHPDLTREDALGWAGAAVGAVLATLTWTEGNDLRTTVQTALQVL